MSQDKYYLEQFKKDLLEVMKKHDVSLDIVAQYDGNDDYCGSELYFKSRLFYVEVRDILP